MAADAIPGTPVLVFARTPEPGRVKTRLIPAIGPERAARLHLAMTRRTVTTAVSAGVGPVELWCTPSTDHPDIDAIAGEHDLAVCLQPGGDLGERMRSALGSRITGSGAAVLIGTDCPTLDAEDLRSAARALASGADAVLGPARDGGYYLIGLRRAVPEVFSDVAWGEEQVLARTRENLRSLGWRWRELTLRADVDRPEDLAELEGIVAF